VIASRGAIDQCKIICKIKALASDEILHSEGSCWAFSTVAAIEGANQIKTGELVSLSEQELVDCDAKAVGCSGGYMSWAYEFVIQNHGLTTESNYPYKGNVSIFYGLLASREIEDFPGLCRWICACAGLNDECQKPKLKQSAVAIAAYRNVTPNSEPELLGAAATQPVSVAIDGGSFMFQLYGSGVFTGPCTADVNHGVTVVGYGESETEGDEDGDGAAEPGQKYWIVKNSWGKGWGQDGYVLMQRDASDASGLCGIALLPSYPLM
jgi:KDEL-tailed cysteine endopeptidase